MRINAVFRAWTEAAVSTLKLYISTLPRRTEESYIKSVTIVGTIIYVLSNVTVYQIFKQIDSPNSACPRIYYILKSNFISPINNNFQLFNSCLIGFTWAFCDQHAFNWSCVIVYNIMKT
jgi:hypothetical protein